jgi:CubicO group peptidase (beta-lactamase class C family)
VTNQTKVLTIFIVGLFLSGMLCSCSASNADQFTVIDSEVEEKILETISDGDLPSLQVAVIDQNQLIWSKAYGQNTNTDFAYMNGSVQKVFDATAILQLYERGLIDLDADINNYIPFQVKHPGYPETPITIKMLLSHRSGLDSFDYQFSWDTECHFYPEYRPVCQPELLKMSIEEYLIASFTPDGLNYNPKVWVNQPGEEYHYSVSAYPLLRYLIEEVTGFSYPDYMQENIFEPLGMLNTGFSSEYLAAQHSIPYTRVSGENIELPVWNGNGYMMRTTAEDMAKFILAVMNDGVYNDYQLLQPETIQLMQTKFSRGKSLLNPNSELSDPGYGLGLIHYPFGWMGHGGSTVGYQTLLQFKPSIQSGFIITTNINGILGSYDDFQSVWGKMASIRDVLLSELDPLATFEFYPWGLIILSSLSMIILIANLITPRLNQKRKK